MNYGLSLPDLVLFLTIWTIVYAFVQLIATVALFDHSEKYVQSVSA